jgi:Holliday junction resolvase RusA-like endonuclease
MVVKDLILAGLKPALALQLKAGVDSGVLKQPVDFKAISESAWRNARSNLQTAGAIMVFHITREDLDKVIREVFVDLKVELKHEEQS